MSVPASDPPLSMPNLHKEEGHESSEADASLAPMTVKRRWPEWVRHGVQWRSLRIFLRAWVVLWCAFLLMLPTRSMNVMGQAVFFAATTAFVLPASMPSTIFFLAAFMVLLGACLGWIWSIAALAASYRARSRHVSLAQLVRTGEELSLESNLDAYFQEIVFRGAFLETNVSVVAGVFFFIGCYALGWISAARPLLKPVALVATIILDVNLSYGPLLPVLTLTLSKTLFYPLGCALAIGLAANLVVCPESTSYGFQCKLVNLLGMSKQMLHKKVRLTRDEQTANDAVDEKAAKELQSDMIKMANGLRLQSAFLELDVTYLYLMPQDLKDLFHSMRTCGIRLLRLHSYDSLQASFPEEEDEEEKLATSKSTRTLYSTMVEPMEMAFQAITVLEEWLQASLTQRNTYDASVWTKSLHDSLTSVEESVHSLTTVSDVRPLKSPTQQNLGDLALLANLCEFLYSLIDLQRLALDIAEKRRNRQIRVHLMGLRKLFRLLNRRGAGVDATGAGTGISPITHDRYNVDEAIREEEQERKSDEQEAYGSAQKDEERAEPPATSSSDPDAARSPINVFQSAYRTLVRICSAFISPVGMFALRYAIASFALWIPSVIPHSAYFVYVNKSVWALVIAQTGLALNMADANLAMLTRLFGTCAGVVLGMLFWYMSCGMAAHGNAYGLGAMMAIGLMPLVWLRLYAPGPWKMFVFTTGVTLMLTIGYAWIDTHMFLLSNAGTAVNVAWKRALLVLVGLTADFIVMLVPRPPSIRNEIRKGLTRNTKEVSTLCTDLFRLVQQDFASQQRTHEVERIQRRVFRLQEMLNRLHRDCDLVKLDLTFRGPWPDQRYVELIEINYSLLQSLGQMTCSLDLLTIQGRKTLQECSGLLDPTVRNNLVLTLSLVFDALEKGTDLASGSAPCLLRGTDDAAPSFVIPSDKLNNDDAYLHTVASMMAYRTFVQQLERLCTRMSRS